MNWIRTRLNRRWLSIVGPIAIIVLFGASVFVLVYSYHLSHPKVEIPGENRHDFARVAILIDGTRSVNPENLPLMKRIVRKKILPSLGVNDVAVAYDVHSDFTHNQNAIFGIEGDQMPRNAEERRLQILDILEQNRETATPDGDLYDLLRKLPSHRDEVEKIRGVWAERLENRDEPEPLGSDICSPLGELGWFLSQGDPEAQRWLFILSDLQDTNPPDTCRFAETFPHARIVLIYPFGSNHPSWQRIEGFWRPFFAEQELDRLPFSAALAGGALLPPNPAAGLDGYEIGTQWECARPMIAPTLVVAAGLIALIAVVVALASARWQSDPQESAT